MKRWVLVLAILCAGCHSCAVAPTPLQRRLKLGKKRPKDRINDIIKIKTMPPWVIKNVAEWINYAYDLEDR